MPLLNKDFISIKWKHPFNLKGFYSIKKASLKKYRDYGIDSEGKESDMRQYDKHMIPVCFFVLVSL